MDYPASGLPTPDFVDLVAALQQAEQLNQAVDPLHTLGFKFATEAISHHLPFLNLSASCLRS
jgi:hypothetical protein